MIFRQERLGRGGAVLVVPKLRTMVRDAPMLEDLVLLNSSPNGIGKFDDHPGVTRLGAVLRRYWIDEIPQLALFARGELDLVGIRPQTPGMLAFYSAKVRDFYEEHGPALIGFQYCVPQPVLDRRLEADRFVERWREDPAATRSAYLGRFVINVLSGMRSS